MDNFSADQLLQIFDQHKTNGTPAPTDNQFKFEIQPIMWNNSNKKKSITTAARSSKQQSPQSMVQISSTDSIASFSTTQSFRLPLSSERMTLMFSNWRTLTTIKTNIEIFNMQGEFNSSEPEPKFSHLLLAPAMQLEHVRDIINIPAFAQLALSKNTMIYLYKLCLSIVQAHAATLIDESILSLDASCLLQDPLTVVSTELGKFKCVLQHAVNLLGVKWLNLQFQNKTQMVKDYEIGQILFKNED